MTESYRRQRNALSDQVGDMIDVTTFGQRSVYLDNSPTSDDYIALARRAYVNGDLTLDEMEVEIAKALAQ